MISIYNSAEFEKHIPRFADILIDAVDSGAGVSFLRPLGKTEAEKFWRDQIESITQEKAYPIVAEIDGTIAGLVLLLRAWAPNQPHRSEVAKLLVHRDFRKRGVASALMQTLETKAKSINQSLLTFDAVAGSSAAKFYLSKGYTCVGIYPRFAYSGNGNLDDTALFYKEL